MKRRKIIACTMQIDVIRHVCQKYNIEADVIWVGRNLHNSPLRLKKKLQELIEQNQEMEEIILSYGLCGRSVEGLKSNRTRLVLPRYHDCICQQLQTGYEKKIDTQKGSIYLTREWTVDHQGIVQQCEEIHEQYGESAREIIDTIYADYNELVVIDTGAYDVDSLKTYVDKASEYTGLSVRIQEGSDMVMKKLLLGLYDDTILQLEPGETVRADMFYALM